MFNKQPHKQLDDILTCFICLSTLTNPHICPCCSKLCCLPCITKWLTENRQVWFACQTQQCPHCRSQLRPQQLVNCRFLEDLVANHNDPCPQHHSQLQYYCLTCSQPICSECAMFSNHKLHDFEHLQKVFDNKVKNVRSKMETVSERLRGLKQQAESLDELVDELNRNKDERVMEIQNFTEQLLQRLETTHQQRLMLLYSQKQSLTNKILHVSGELDEVQSQIKSLQRSKTIMNADELLLRVEAINTDPEPTGGVPLNFPSELTPEYLSDTFELSNFSRQDEIIYSDHLVNNGIKWRLKVYPRGNGSAKNEYISIFLEMDSRFPEVRRYEYKLEMLNQRTGLPLVREFSSEFEGGECWGYNRFFRIDLLQKDGYLKDDRLKFKYHVRAPNYHTECLDMRRYIKKLEQQLLINKQEQHSSVMKLKEEIEQYAEKLDVFDRQSEQSEVLSEQEQTISQNRQLQQQSQSEEDEESSISQDEYIFDGHYEELPIQNMQLIEQPVRRNLIQKFNQSSLHSTSPQVRSPLSEFNDNIYN